MFPTNRKPLKQPPSSTRLKYSRLNILDRYTHGVCFVCVCVLTWYIIGRFLCVIRGYFIHNGVIVCLALVRGKWASDVLTNVVIDNDLLYKQNKNQAQRSNVATDSAFH